MKFKAIYALIFTISILGMFLFLLRQKAHFGPKIAVLDAQKNDIGVYSTVQALASQGTCVADALKADLGENHALLVKKLQTAFPIDQNIWQNTLKMIDSAINQDRLLTKNPIIKNKKSDHELVKMARKILASYNINPSKVTIRTINDPKDIMTASTNQGYSDNTVIHELELNLAHLEKKSAETQEAVIRHETMHMLHYDPLVRAFIKNMLLENGIPEENLLQEPALQKLYQYQELRADLLAACHSINTAYSLQKDFEKHMKSNPQDPASYITHPTDQARHQAVTQLIGYLEAENKIKLV